MKVKLIYTLLFFGLISCKSYNTNSDEIHQIADVSNQNLFDLLNIKIKTKTNADICTILEDIRTDLHKNDSIIKVKYKSSWTEQAYQDLEILNKNTITSKIANYGITIDEYIEINNAAIDICHTSY